MRCLILLFLLFGCVGQPVAEDNAAGPDDDFVGEPEIPMEPEPPQEEVPEETQHQPEGPSVLDLNQSSFNFTGVSTHKDVSFSGKSSTLKMDLFIPENESNPPIIIYVHGGGWLTGSKEECPAGLMLHHGFAVSCTSYRLSDEMKFPAQIEDVKSAIRFVREKAETYGYNGDRIGLWGPSAGGHLVALAGTSGDSHEVDSGNVSSRVQAVVDYFGPVDFTLAPNTDQVDKNKDEKEYYITNESRAIVYLLDGSVEEKPELARQANPITYVTWDDPPFLILHGDNDITVSVENSRRLYQALDEAGVDATYIEIPGAGHGFDLVDAEGNPTEEWNATISFLKYKLMKCDCPKASFP